MNDADKFVSVLGLFLLCMFVWGIVANKTEFEKIKEAEIIVIGKREWSNKRVAIETATGRTYILLKVGAENIHAGHSYWIRYQFGKIIDWENLGKVDIISVK